MAKEIEIPEGYEARIEGNKVIIAQKESEDERIRKELMNFVAKVKDIAKSGRDSWAVRKEDVEMCERFLAYLEKQKEQKPAEWSEEDETAFGDLMWCIEQARKSARDENDMGNIWFAENWVKNKLKSLRPQPHWKPSEEQLSILGKVFAGCQLKDSERDSMVDLFYHLKDMI